MKKYSIGIDFGTLSARAVLIDVENGEMYGTDSVFAYPHGVMTSLDGKDLPFDYALQHPMDYVEAVEHVLREVVSANGIDPSCVVGIGVDFTACTVLPLDKCGVPMCLDAKYSSEPHAYAKLWKHHGAEKYLDKINDALDKYGRDMLYSTGGNMASEFMIPKLYEVYTEAPEIYKNASLFINSGDYVCSLLGGGVSVHSTAYAAIKEHYVPHLGGYPSREFFALIDEGFAGVVEEKLKVKKARRCLAFCILKFIACLNLFHNPFYKFVVRFHSP